jgi:hypothetical protein
VSLYLQLSCIFGHLLALTIISDHLYSPFRHISGSGSVLAKMRMALCHLMHGNGISDLTPSGAPDLTTVA